MKYEELLSFFAFKFQLAPLQHGKQGGGMRDRPAEAVPRRARRVL
jgi:hypothetical protein